MESNTLTPADPTRPADVELDVQSSAEASRSTDETISANANRHAEEPRQAILLLPVEAIKTTSDLNSSIVPGESLPVEPNPKLRLSIPEALQKLETIMNAIHPRRKRGPKICHAIRISRQIFKDLGTHVRDVGALWTAMGRRQKFSNIAGRQVWLPSPAELENVKEAVFDVLVNDDGSWNFYWERRKGDVPAVSPPSQVVGDYIQNETGVRLVRKEISSRMSGIGASCGQLDRLEALRNMHALFDEYETTKERCEESDDGSEVSTDNGYES
ncbi:MAG: hypothetical protein L6R38_004264 [Xanthoria sp. 2 TBL-2021]|nr:MAG: hypothetical protein L6R38_004264 [Xanthoria sp. 2 TBL-2021]